jgi:cell division protein ZapA (FtsZ GTPase activity inhibitor)
MTIHSRSLISELKNFVASGGSYAAKVGDTDDLVMAALLIVRMLQQLQDFHQDIEGRMRDHEEFTPPLPFFAVIS